MKEYIDIDKNVIVYDTRGRRCEVTVRHILEKNHGEYEIDDVVLVVRCKNCWFFNSERQFCSLHEAEFSPDAFCSYATRDGKAKYWGDHDKEWEG